MAEEEITAPLFRTDPLVAARAIQRITNDELAKMLEIAPMTLRRVMRGQDCRVSSVKKVAAALGVSICSLFDSDVHNAQSSTESLTGKAES